MKIRNIAIIKLSEAKGYLVSPAAYVFVIIFLVLSGFFTFMVSNFFQAGEASLRSFFWWHPLLYLVLVPAVGMHLWADERRMGTVELLFTMPLTVFETVLGKFAAAWMVVAVALAMTFPMVITVYKLGSPDTGMIVCGYIGSFLVAGTYLAVASFTSSITRSQVVSFIVSVLICLFLFLAGWPPVTGMLVNWAPVQVVNTVANCSVMPHFNNMQRGIIDLRDIMYFASMTTFFLFCTGIVLKNHRMG
ncbi:MAG: ABC transporter permease subunit [Victivallales bacterium]|nr:ABC transporter permease subunit [Victivallales bacterium]